MRGRKELEKIPVIAVSAGGKAAREMAQQAGADFFVEKPMRLREILETVRKLLVL
jgi:DNA-binding response OmpR family regulator